MMAGDWLYELARTTPFPYSQIKGAWDSLAASLKRSGVLVDHLYLRDRSRLRDAFENAVTCYGRNGFAPDFIGAIEGVAGRSLNLDEWIRVLSGLR